MSRALLRLCLLLLFLPGSASAADLGIAAFEGVWQGSVVSESAVSANFQLTSRDIDVTIRVDGGGGFNIVWNTVQRQKGDPLTAASPYAWAYIKDRGLKIITLRIYPDGRHETQIYNRTLSGTGMVLDFVRNVDGAQMRQATGRLIKVAK